jgi:3-oxoadipate enol-lactonase/4-carboxymuconolactone decarboxylase
MPLLTIAGTSCYYRLEGPDDAPVLMLVHSLGQDHGMWEPQAASFSTHFRVLRYDLRGHGASGVTPGDYSIEQLGRDALALADALGFTRFAFCGLSIGGMIGQWLAANAPQRLTHAVLANTSPKADAAGMETRRQAVLSGGMAAVADTVMGRFFSPATLASGAAAAATSRRTLLATDPVGYAGCCAAIRDMDLRASAARIDVPTLLISGDLDVSLPWTGHGELLGRDIQGARIVHLRAAHLSNLERPRSFTAAVLQFLLPGISGSRDDGLKIRREMLGAEHVERSLATHASSDFQELITRFAWGSIWTRPGLDARTRRLLVLVISASMGRWEEFRLHVRAGLQRELEWCDLEEVLLQTAVYAGVPAANTAFHIAAEERNAVG